jgi:hypothetical protein
MLLAWRKIILALVEATAVNADDVPARVVEKFCELGLIERRNGTWQLTEVGEAMLESLGAVKQ